MQPESTARDTNYPSQPGIDESLAQHARTRSAMQPLIIAGVIFIGALLGIFVLISSGDDDPIELNASLLTLELGYPISGEPTAVLSGEATAAPPGAPVTCRRTADKQALGEGEARDDGSIALPLDASAWPIESLSGDAWKTLNDSLECRAGSGPWVQPLRQPRIAIN